MSSFCKCKSYSDFFRKNICIYAIFNDQSFKNTLTNIISFKQLGPGIKKVNGYTWWFSTIFWQGRQLLWLPVLPSCTTIPSEKVYILKGKNLLPMGRHLYRRETKHFRQSCLLWKCIICCSPLPPSIPSPPTPPPTTSQQDMAKICYLDRC